jgi:condensin complex subunit 1
LNRRKAYTCYFRSKRRSGLDGDSMDVDEDDNASERDSIMDEDEADAENSQDQPGEEYRKKKRKTELDLSMLTEEQVALAALESNRVLQYKLRKKYCAEGVQFISTIEDAMDGNLGKLLGSKNKAEVLEAMEFFRVAHEYHFDGAQVSSM